MSSETPATAVTSPDAAAAGEVLDDIPENKIHSYSCPIQVATNYANAANWTN